MIKKKKDIISIEDKKLIKKYKNIYDKINISYKLQYNFIYSFYETSNLADKLLFINQYILKNKINNTFRYYLSVILEKNEKNDIDLLDYNLFHNEIIKNLKEYNDKICKPFWNEKINNISNNIFLPTNDSLEKIKYIKTFNYKNWFETEHYKSNIQKNNIEIEKNREFICNNKIIKCKKVKIYFNKEQRYGINKLFGIYRYFYNRAIQYINNFNKETNLTYFYINYNDKNSIINVDLNNIKNRFSMNTMRLFLKKDIPEWLDIIYPSHLADKAFSEASDNFFKCIKTYNKNHKPFNLHLKTKKDIIQTLNIEKLMISKDRKSIFSNLKINNKNIFKNLKFSENINGINILDSSISYNKILKIYYLNLNYKDIKKKLNKDLIDTKKVCSIDPGLKSFLTIYSDNEVNKIGVNITDRINKVCKEVDILTSKIYKKKVDNKKQFYNNSNKRKNMKKALHRRTEYLKNLKKELHNKSIKFLSYKYAKIITPPFETQDMSCKFNSKIARNLYNISYYSFLTKLKKRCLNYDIELLIKPEYYTSKTCTCCGNIDYNLGSNRTYNCLKCKIIIDRDINGARNIMLRNNY